MSDQLNNRRIAILATDGFEQDELILPREALENAGANTEIISIKPDKIKGWKNSEWGGSVAVDQTVEESSPAEFDALLLPGGVMNPDKLRANANAVNFVRHFIEARKPIAAICHGPWTLIDAGGVRGRTLTSWPSLKTDLQNAGASWVDREVVVDNGLVTSRKPEDIAAFNAKMIEEFAEGIHGSRKTA